MNFPHLSLPQSPSNVKRRFDEDGFVLIKEFVSAEGVHAIKKSLDQSIQHKIAEMPREHVFYDDLNNKDSLKQIQKLFLYDPLFEHLMFNSEIFDLAKLLLNGPVTCQNMQYFDKPPVTNHPTPPHQDGFYFMLQPCEAITFWLALDKTDEENGCVRYLPGSHLHGLRQHSETETLGFSKGISDYANPDALNEIAIPAEPGDLLAHHALTIHRADRNKSAERHRRALGLIYYSANAAESPEKKLRHQEQMQHLARQGKI